jgi:hypothetical protein
MSGRSWMTTLPPVDSSSVQRLAGSAATAAGAAIDAVGAAGATGAGLAATRATAIRGTANHALLIMLSCPSGP